VSISTICPSRTFIKTTPYSFSWLIVLRMRSNPGTDSLDDFARLIFVLMNKNWRSSVMLSV
jgi:hypothetical protein